MTITPAEAKTIRERIGVPTQFVADHLGVTKGRVWDYESPKRTRNLPDHASTGLLHLGSVFDRAVSKAATKATKAGYVPRHRSLEDFERWCPDLKGWGVGAQAALVAAVSQQAALGVDYR